MTARPATADDVQAVVLLSEDAAVTAGEPKPDRSRLHALVLRLIAEPGGAVFVVDSARGPCGSLVALGMEDPLTGDARPSVSAIETRRVAWRKRFVSGWPSATCTLSRPTTGHVCSLMRSAGSNMQLGR